MLFVRLCAPVRPEHIFIGLMGEIETRKKKLLLSWPPGLPDSQYLFVSPSQPLSLILLRSPGKFGRTITFLEFSRKG